jgi:hypothetical protein
MLKTFKSYTNEEKIMLWLEFHDTNFKNNTYTINKEGIIDVKGTVSLAHGIITKIPYQFGNIDGGFYCYNTRLTTLKNAPFEVNGDFWVQHNDLISLEYAPSYIQGNVYIFNNLRLIKIGGCKYWTTTRECLVEDNYTPFSMYRKIFTQEEFKLLKANTDLFDKLDVFKFRGEEIEFNVKKFIRFLVKVGANEEDCNPDILAENAIKEGFYCDW